MYQTTKLKAMTKDEIEAMLDEFYIVCKRDPKIPDGFFTGYLEAAFIDIAINPRKIGSVLQIIKNKINEIKSQTNEAGKADLIN